MSQPFARATAMMAAIAAAISAGSSIDGFHYVSRGKGKGRGQAAFRMRRRGAPYPFSSNRQHARTARTQRTVIVNGFALMQTIPAIERLEG